MDKAALRVRAFGVFCLHMLFSNLLSWIEVSEARDCCSHLLLYLHWRRSYQYANFNDDDCPLHIKWAKAPPRSHRGDSRAAVYPGTHSTLTFAYCSQRRNDAKTYISPLVILLRRRMRWSGSRSRRRLEESTGRRSSFARMAFADWVQTNGFERALCSAR